MVKATDKEKMDLSKKASPCHWTLGSLNIHVPCSRHVCWTLVDIYIYVYVYTICIYICIYIYMYT